MMRPHSRIISCFCFILITGIVLHAQNGAPATGTPAPAATNGTSTGQRIGNIISAAVSTAFPAVSSVIKAIWPNGATNAVKPQQATPALQAAKDQSTAAQKTNSDALTAAAKDLAVLRTFVTECGFASSLQGCRLG